MDEDARALEPLLTEAGWELLDSLPPYDEADALNLNRRLRQQGHSPELVAAALTQSQLRAEGRAKFGDFSSRMLLTREGLQQSTRLPAAARHAERFRAAGLSHLADLGCGMGGDALAAASLGLKVVAVEADEAAAAAATMNLLPFPETDVVHSTAEDFMAAHGPLPQGWGLWLDPSRRDTAAGKSARGETRRLWDPESFSPPLSFVTAWAATGIPLGVKLGPGVPHELIPQGCEAEWVSLDGDVVEVVLWFNALARPGVRRAATVMRTGGEPAELTTAADFGEGPDAAPAGREGLQGVLYEPDGAVIRAGLVADLAAASGGDLLDEHIAYFCVPEPDDEPGAGPDDEGGEAPGGERGVGPELGALARGYRVMEVMDYSPRRLKQWAQAEGVTSLEIKKRGVDVVPEQLRRQVLPKSAGTSRRSGDTTPGAAGERPAEQGPVRRTLVLTRLGEQRAAAVVEPLTRPDPS